MWRSRILDARGRPVRIEIADTGRRAFQMVGTFPGHTMQQLPRITSEGTIVLFDNGI